MRTKKQKTTPSPIALFRITLTIKSGKLTFFTQKWNVVQESESGINVSNGRRGYQINRRILSKKVFVQPIGDNSFRAVPSLNTTMTIWTLDRELNTLKRARKLLRLELEKHLDKRNAEKLLKKLKN